MNQEFALKNQFMTLLSVLAWVAIIYAITGCTVTPATVKNSAPLLDPVAVASINPDGSAVLTSSGLAQYNALVGRYGADPLFLPALQPSQSNTINATQLADMLQMREWQRSQTH